MTDKNIKWSKFCKIFTFCIQVSEKWTKDLILLFSRRCSHDGDDDDLNPSLDCKSNNCFIMMMMKETSLQTPSNVFKIEMFPYEP